MSDKTPSKKTTRAINKFIQAVFTNVDAPDDTAMDCAVHNSDGVWEFVFFPPPSQPHGAPVLWSVDLQGVLRLLHRQKRLFCHDGALLLLEGRIKDLSDRVRLLIVLSGKGVDIVCHESPWVQHHLHRKAEEELASLTATRRSTEKPN